MVEEYGRDPSSITAIATRHGLSLSWTGRVLRRHGADLPARRQGVKRTDIDPLNVAALYVVADLPIQDVSEKLRVSYNTVRRILIKLGIEIRPRGVRNTKHNSADRIQRRHRNLKRLAALRDRSGGAA
uniref:helix-turn-helix domain-containing protein n=1 Tax=Amycolatopsis sp. CA-096443 TaxID=3239919 RepID=UPI003F4964EF